MAKPVAVTIYGLKETQRALKEIPEAMEDMKVLHKRVGEMVLEGAKRRMPSRSGALRSSYKSSRIKSGAKVSSSLVYAGVSEFGGTIPRFHSASRTFHKPPAGRAGLDSYYVYPAAEDRMGEIKDLYYDEIERLKDKYLKEV